VTTERGRKMPLNPEPDPIGNVIMLETEDGEEVAHQLRRGEEPDLERYMPHFATCGRQVCECDPADSPTDNQDADSPLSDAAVIAQAIDRAVQVLDHHATRVHNELQNITVRLGDITDQLERRS
jgi:hypothetical protein